MSSAKSLAQRSVQEKLLLAGGAATFALCSSNVVEAGIVSAQGTPILSKPTRVTTWDVDGDSTPDFGVDLGGGDAYLTEQNGGRIVRTTGANFAKLSAGFLVGSAMIGHDFSAAPFRFEITYDRSIGSISAGGFTEGVAGFFGFKFTSGANTYYGWAEMIVVPTGDFGYEITRAYYNNTPGTTIAVGDTGATVPEPSTCALALLAAGGAAAYRRRKPAAV